VTGGLGPPPFVVLLPILVMIALHSHRVFCGECESGAEAPAIANPEAPPDGRALIDALASRNRAPVLHGGDEYEMPRFAGDFNWADQERVVAAIRRLVGNAQQVWPDIVAHLGDERYCVTYDFDTPARDGPGNLSVGDICKWIISDYLSQAYLWHIPDAGERAYTAFFMPDIARHGNAALKAWCETRRNKKLYELQAEVCEWAVREAAKADGPLSELSDEHRRAVVAGIKGEIAELRESRRPVKSEGFSGKPTESWSLYTLDRIKEMHKSRAEARGRGEEGGGIF
jgi:hypothetical protein